MPRYVDADALVAILEAKASMALSDPAIGLYAAARCCKALPAAEVEPVRHGYWFLRGGRFRCSVCDGKALWNCDGGTGGYRCEYTQAESSRCPHCGAIMDLKEGASKT